MRRNTPRVERRMLLTGGLSAMAWAAVAGRSEGAEPTAVERANMRVVQDFCDAWPSHDLERILAFFSETGAYRMTETMEPAKGREALMARINTIIKNVNRFEILDTWARGPMVINERIDTFSNFQLKSWRGVGVFFLRDQKIVEWYDYTIAAERV